MIFDQYGTESRTPDTRVWGGVVILFGGKHDGVRIDVGHESHQLHIGEPFTYLGVGPYRITARLLRDRAWLAYYEGEA